MSSFFNAYIPFFSIPHMSQHVSKSDLICIDLFLNDPPIIHPLLVSPQSMFPFLQCNPFPIIFLAGLEQLLMVQPKIFIVLLLP